jgi:hypothetical protein
MSQLAFGSFTTHRQLQNYFQLIEGDMKPRTSFLKRVSEGFSEVACVLTVFKEASKT